MLCGLVKTLCKKTKEADGTGVADETQEIMSIINVLVAEQSRCYGQSQATEFDKLPFACFHLNCGGIALNQSLAGGWYS